MQGGEHGQIISDVVELRYRGRTVRGALFAVAGHPDDCVTVHLGYGRTRAGRVGSRRRLQRESRSARRTRCGSAPALEIVQDRRRRIRSRARSITT